MPSTRVNPDRVFSPVNELQSAYVHIPFCRRRCYYCDFPVSIVGDKPPIAPHNENSHPLRLNGSNSGTIAQYVDILCREIQLTPRVGQPLNTVFFGGGTPSLLSVEQVVRILATLDRQFGIASQAEISMEIDPGTFDLAQIRGYRTAGVNRVSLGVQAFQPELLTACGRSHTVSDVYAAVELVRQAGCENFSLDLISGLPHQSLAHWQDSLQQAIALAPTHISCYDLTIEPITAFGRQYKPGLLPLPSDETTAKMYRMARALLTAAGYEHYEISNYAKPGYQCRHNRVYWENRPFYGFGMGATSYVGGDRVARPRKTREYYAWVEEMEAQGTPATQLPIANRQSPSEQLLDTLMVGLRLADGLDLAVLRERFGPTPLERVWNRLQPYCQKGWVALNSGPSAAELPAKLPTTGRLRLTDPEGFLFSNVILVDLFEEFE